MKTGNNKRRPRPKENKGRYAFAIFKRSKKTASERPVRMAPQASASFLVLTLLVVAVTAAAFVYHLHVRFEGVWLGYETSRARSERARLIVERRELRLELASLKSPGEVEAEAREKLGMEMPDHDRIIPIGKTLKPVLASGRVR